MHHRQGSPSTPGSLFLQGPLGEDPDTLHPHLGELRADLEPIRDLLIGPSIESGTAGGLLRNEQLAGKIRRVVLELGVEAAAPITGQNHLAERVLEKMVAELMANAGRRRTGACVSFSMISRADPIGSRAADQRCDPSCEK